MKEERLDIMTTATLLKNEEFQFANEMEAYVNDFKSKVKKNGKEQYRDDALAALKRTGVVTSKGNTRKKIVSWE